MEIADVRDWIIVIFGFLGIGAIVTFIILLIILYRKIVPILDSAKETAENVRATSSIVSKNVIQPIAKVQGIITGARKAAEVVASMKKRGGGNEENG